MISVEWKGTIFPVRFGNRLNKGITKENFKNDLMNLIETKHQINMASDYCFKQQLV